VHEKVLSHVGGVGIRDGRQTSAPTARLKDGAAHRFAGARAGRARGLIGRPAGWFARIGIAMFAGAIAASAMLLPRPPPPGGREAEQAVADV
jgi:hypothetical protein